MINKSQMKKFFSKAAAFTLALGMVFTSVVLPVRAEESSDKVEYSRENATMRSVMYYGDWSIWGGQGNFYPSGIPAEYLTHLNFAFLDFDANGNLMFTDKDAAVGAPVGMSDVQWGGANAGILNAMQDLRANNPNLRIGVSVGGWSKSGDFSTVTADSAKRQTLISNLMKYIKYTNMDFVDIDWEYPASERDPDKVDNTNDEGTPNATAADKANYITFLRELRSALDAQGEELSKDYELSVAIPAGKNQLQLGIDIPALFEVVDFANIMTYDLHGAWDSVSGHQTGLYTNPADPFAASGFSVDGSVQYLLSEGAPANKIVVGAAFYTRGWEQVADDGGVAGNPGLFGTASKVNKDADQTLTYGALNEAPIKSGEGGRCGGVWGYGSLSQLKAKYSGLVEYWDDAAKAPYLYNASTGAFFTYDNARSIQAKAEYVLDNNLGGMIAWMQSQDATTSTGRRDELTKVMKEGLFGTQPLTQYNISKSAIDVSVTVQTYSENANKGYEITIKNNAAGNESGEVLSLLELAAETVKSPKLYIKTTSGATFSSGGYGSGTVTNSNGYGIADLSTVYDNKLISQGATVTFKLQVNGTVSLSDIEKIELSQRIIPSGVEISRQEIAFTTVGGDPEGETPTDPTNPTDPTDPTEPENPGDITGEYSNSKVYVEGDVVTYNGATYRAKWWTQGMAPGGSGGPWELISSSGNGDDTSGGDDNGGTETPDPGIAEYDATAIYVTGDTVTYNGVTYRAKWWTRGDIPGESDPWELVQ